MTQSKYPVLLYMAFGGTGFGFWDVPKFKPSRQKSFTFPCLLLLFFLSMGKILATGFEFGYTVTSLSSHISEKATKFCEITLIFLTLLKPHPSSNWYIPLRGATGAACALKPDKTPATALSYFAKSR